ncbi:MAG: hypothetical protein IKA94_07420 [Mogibacterium sp.]|nr:hypothetical protein [Mogibacterium sp.]
MNNTIVVIEAGWIMVGEMTNPSTQTTLLKNASVVRRWNNGKGIGGLAKAENKHEYTLDPVGSVSIQTSKILFEIPCEW